MGFIVEKALSGGTIEAGAALSAVDVDNSWHRDNFRLNQAIDAKKSRADRLRCASSKLRGWEVRVRCED